MKGPTVKELQALLRARGLPVSGRKAALIERLASADAGAAPPSPRVRPPADAPAPRMMRPPVGDSIPLDVTPRTLSVSKDRLRVATWNVAGLRGLLGRDAGVATLRHLVDEEEVDVLMLQETKLQEHHVPQVEADLLGVLDGGGGRWRAAWACSTARKGYSGVATTWCDRRLGRFSATAHAHALPIDPGHEADQEGRTLLLELPLASVGSAEGSAEAPVATLGLLNVYTPNAGADLQRLDYRTGAAGWDEQFRAALVRHLEPSTPAEPSGGQRASPGRHLCVGGDLNVAVEDDDFFNPHEARMARQAGTTPQERESMRR